MSDIVEWLEIEARRDPEIQHAGHSRLSDAADEIKRLRAGLRLMIEEITDLEGREGLSDSDWAEQVIALAQQQRDALL